MAIPLIKGIMDRIKDHEKKPQRMIFWRTISDISLALYFLTDHPLYLQRIGFARYDKSFINNCDFINNVFWLINSLLDIMCDIVDLYHIQHEIQTLKQQISSQKSTNSATAAIGGGAAPQ